MPSKARDRQLAKLAARRKAERDAANRRRRITAGAVGGVIGLVAIVIGFKIVTAGNGTAGASATPTVSATPTGPPTKTGTVTPTAPSAKKVACGATKPAAADTPKPQFDHAPSPNDVLKPDTVYTAEIKTSCGTITVKLDAAAAPETVASFVFLARQGYFDGTFFHRVVDSIDVIQGGDPTGTGHGGPGYVIPDELTGKEKYTPGTVVMANASTPNSGGSQFFIVTGPGGAGLNANYTIFGSVAEGLDVAKTINALIPTGKKLYDGQPTEAVYIEKVTIHETKAPKPTPSVSASSSPSA
jgi:cyclophilin family peptidyl-prolyl cis-trans isomerase